jgi:hypothetical protein
MSAPPDDPAAARYPNTARIWNYQLGGGDNYPVDQEASAAANAMVRGTGVPAGADTAIESRHLLQRMVDYMLGQGVRQFLDLGSGLTNMASTHQIAHRLAARGLVRPAQWRPDLDNPLRLRAEDAGDDELVLRQFPVPGSHGDGSGAAWHLCGIGIKARQGLD